MKTVLVVQESLWKPNRQNCYKKKPNYSSTETFVLYYIKDFKKV